MFFPILHINTIAESKKIIESVLKQYKERGIGRWAAIEKNSGEFIGLVWNSFKHRIQHEWIYQVLRCGLQDL
jgi:hypothetical protein